MLVKHDDGFIGPGSVPRHAREVLLDALAEVVDPYFARALDPAIGCWLVRGHLPHRIARLIETLGTASARPRTGRNRRPSSTA
jgi:hypothetical protein